MRYDLECRYDTRKSFYGKAIVEENETDVFGEKELDKRLFSYGTIVGRVYQLGNKITYYYFGKYSQTTTRHQKEFFKQFGLSDNEIKTFIKSGKAIYCKYCKEV